MLLINFYLAEVDFDSETRSPTETENALRDPDRVHRSH